METVWQRRVESAVKKAILCSVFAGFNTNVDAVVHCNGTSIASLLQDPDVSLDAANALDVSQIETIREKK